jgi:hypothetical protein
MAILMVLELPGATVEQYDKVHEVMADSGGADAEGLVSHVAGPTDDGLLIIDVSESEDAMNRFVGEQVAPAMEEVGVPQARPRIFPVHNLIRKGRGQQAGVILIIESDSFGSDDYDRVTAKMDANAGDGSNHPAVSHVAGVCDGGMVFVDVWESPEAFGRFAEQELGPASASAGADLGPVEPRFVPVHNRMVGKG